MKLLYAEDEEEMSEAVVDILTYHKYTVDAVYDGEEALSYAHAEQYDGIILDVMMPKKSGRLRCFWTMAALFRRMMKTGRSRMGENCLIRRWTRMLQCQPDTFLYF